MSRLAAMGRRASLRRWVVRIPVHCVRVTRCGRSPRKVFPTLQGAASPFTVKEFCAGARGRTDPCRCSLPGLCSAGVLCAPCSDAFPSACPAGILATPHRSLSVLKIHWQNWRGGSSRRRCGHGLGGYIFLRTIGRPMQHMIHGTLPHPHHRTSTSTSHDAADITHHLTEAL